MSALLIFLVIVIVVTSTLLYLYFNKLGPWKKGASPAPAPGPAPGPALPSITDFSVDRTLSPDKGETYTIEPYTIEPYTIEGYTPEDLKKLSENVTFTLEWTNGTGFTEAKVSKIEVHHGVMSGTTFDNSWELRETIEANSTNDLPPLGLNNFETVTLEISGNGAYSFAGRNFFKIVAYYGNDSIELHNDYTLYNGAKSQDEQESYGIEILNEQLVSTLSLATPETIIYEPRLDSSEDKQSIGRTIDNQYYDFYYYHNVSTSTDSVKMFDKVRLVPVGDVNGKKFKLKKKCLYKSDNNCGWYRPLVWNDLTSYTFRKDDYAVTGLGDAIEFEIAESEEEKGLDEVNDAEKLKQVRKGFEKVIMLKANIDDEDKYLFGNSGFSELKTLNDNSIDNNDKFFRRNIYIKKHEE